MISAARISLFFLKKIASEYSSEAIPSSKSIFTDETCITALFYFY